jgi:hypothetical protein
LAGHSAGGQQSKHHYDRQQQPRPGLHSVLGVDRKWRFGEQSELKFRVESFNVANTPHHSNPTNNVNSGGFMEALGIRNTGRDGLDERNFRVGLKFSW